MIYFVFYIDVWILAYFHDILTFLFYIDFNLRLQLLNMCLYDF